MRTAPPKPFEPQLPPARRAALRKLLRHGWMAVSFNACIAVFLSIFGSEPWQRNMVYSQLIGLSIWLLIDGTRHLLHPQGHVSAKTAAFLAVFGGLAGYFLGSSLGNWVLGHPILGPWRHAPSIMAAYLLMSLLAAGLGVYFFMTREMLSAERTKTAHLQRQATEAQLQLLQSQLDPHMLFNTLANLRVLIQSEPARAVQMLDQLGDFLRATLSASRASEHSLQAEFDRLRDYLALMQIRMGSRLAFALDLPAALAQQRVPTLILQSLVENAVLHGLEPKVEGGRVLVSAATQGADLLLQVTDDGLGWNGHAGSEGFGISQVRERLHNLYGDQATLKFIALGQDNAWAEGLNEPQNTGFFTTQPRSGCQVTLRLPLAA